MYNYEKNLYDTEFYFGEEVEHLRLKGAGKRLKEKAKKAVKKVGEKIKDVAKKLSPADAVYLPLLPFKLAMMKALKKKGIKHGKSMPEVAFAFAKHIVKKENLDDETPTAADKLKEVAGQVQEVGGVVGSAAGIVKIIISFFKKNDQKTKEGTANAEEMELKLDAEEGIAALDNSDEADIEKAAKGQSTGQTRSATEPTPAATGMNPKTIMILAGVVLVVLLMRRK